jgi:serine/threonine protein kinase
MPPPMTMPAFQTLLVRSRLLGGEGEVKSVLQRWAGEVSDREDIDSLRKFLVARGYLTEFQAAMLQRGHSDGFFLDQYRLLERVGQGRMAGVYKAVHALGQTVAIKVLPPSKARDTQSFGRFQREARLATQLSHPNVVRTFQVGEAGGKHYLVMEYLEGETLEDVLGRRTRLPINEAVRIAHQTLLGLQHLAEKGVVHRDLKPANLMLVPGRQKGQPDTTLNSTVKVLDIGLGKAMFDEGEPTPEVDPQLTGDGVLLGTPDYLAPEQARAASSADIRSDLYSLGCVLYHALTGQPPFPDKNVLSQIVRHATETPKTLAETGIIAPPALQQFVGTLMAKDPAQRFPSPAQALQAIQPLLSPDSMPTAEVPAVTPAYQNWLGNPSEPAPTRPAEKPTAPAPKARPTPPAATPELPVGKLDDRPKPPRPKPGTGENRAVAAADEFDVELVPAVPPTAPPSVSDIRPPYPTRLEDLDRRDYIMLGAGAGAVLFAVFLGWLMAQLLRFGRSAEKPTPPTKPAEE